MLPEAPGTARDSWLFFEIIDLSSMLPVRLTGLNRAAGGRSPTSRSRFFPPIRSAAFGPDYFPPQNAAASLKREEPLHPFWHVAYFPPQNAAASLKLHLPERVGAGLALFSAAERGGLIEAVVDRVAKVRVEEFSAAERGGLIEAALAECCEAR